MSKRSAQFARVERDFYPTPAAAVVPLLPHLAPGTAFFEPCAGDGALIDHLEAFGHRCAWAFDIAPADPRLNHGDAMQPVHPAGADCFITNPPWSRELLHPIIMNLQWQLPTWLLFDADWAHTAQARGFRGSLRKIVSVGRVEWFPGTGMTGKDNCAWYLFDARPPAATSAAFFMQGEG